jgi:CspA family cold shock protein
MSSDQSSPPSTGTVEWFDPTRGSGLISCDDGALPCAIRSGALRDTGLSELSAGDRVQFRVREDDGVRTATDLTLLPALQRWENEGGAGLPQP